MTRLQVSPNARRLGSRRKVARRKSVEVRRSAVDVDTLGQRDAAELARKRKSLIFNQVVGVAMQTGTSSDATDVLGRSASVTARLQLQAQVYDPFMRQLAAEAGITPGMKVLDVGCGAGDVAFLRSFVAIRASARESASKCADCAMLRYEAGQVSSSAPRRRSPTSLS
jgi:hypothetical protein